MNILINANCSVGGGLQVCNSLIRTLTDFPEHRFVVCASAKVMESLGGFAAPPHVRMLPCPHPGILRRLCGKNPAMDKIVSDNGIDVVFTVFGPSYWRPKVPHLCGFAIAHYVFPDSDFLKQRSLTEKIIQKFRNWSKMKFFLKQSDALVSENPEVAERLTKMYGCKRSYTVYNSFNPVFSDQTLWDRSEELPKFDGTTLLTIASYYPHKNLEITVPTARCLKEKYPDFKFRFVLSIRREQLQTNIAGLEEHFVFLGGVSISQCPYLYQQSQIMFLPTLLECFSAAWAEAMVMEIPILTSDLPFARGICQDAAMYVDPYSPEKIADSIHKLASSSELKQSLIRNGISVRQRFADSRQRMEKYLNIMQELLDSRAS